LVVEEEVEEKAVPEVEARCVGVVVAVTASSSFLLVEDDDDGG